MPARILVVDDILPNVKLLEAKLSAEYYDVITAQSGEDAIRRAQNDSPDMILLDVMMPGMDGFETCQRLKSDPQTAHIPIVMVTALTDSEDKVKGLESGADDFLSKPVNDIALMARVRSLVRLKMAADEWRARERTASQFGVAETSGGAIAEKTTNAAILVIEDLDFDLSKMDETLSQDNAIVLAAPDGLTAMEMVAAQDFDLLIVSLNLASEDGLRLCSHLRSNERTRNTPILMVANEDDLPRIAQGLEIGAHDYILRPIDRNELRARARTQIRRKRYQERLKSNYEMSLSMALTDALTGLYNRRYFEVHLQKLLQSAAASRKSVGLLYMDIDHFKSVNDTHGHGIGDKVLQVFAQRIRDNLRSFDLVARLGGEEFVAVLPDTTEDMAHFIAERLRRSIAETPFTVGPSLNVTTSLGGVLITPDENAGDTALDAVLKRADTQLYKAKSDGRNCIYFESGGRLDESAWSPQARPRVE
ncbi:MAG: PleD family two-component system response regulator [Pseudomonadota bacterium]